MSNESLQNVGKSFSSAFSSFTASLKPLGSEVSKGFVQAQQYAKEKISGTADVTELPLEYRQLEEKVDTIKLNHELFVKVARNYIIPAYDYEPPALDKVAGFASSVGANAASLAEKLSGTSLGSPTTHQEVPPSLSHAFAKVAFQSAELVGTDEPLGAALKKFATTQERVGGFRLQQDQDAAQKFYYPILRALEGRITDSSKSRRLVQANRLTYDSCRSRLKSASPSRTEAIRAEMVQSEDEFVAAVDEAMGKMKLVLENGEALRCLSDLVAIQLQYHKAAAEALSALSPELDELVVTNEALYSPAEN